MKKGRSTLLWSIAMSAPGPLILGVGLLMGRSNTQIADLIRRSIELLAIIASFITYSIIARRHLSPLQVKRLERNTNLFVGASMVTAGLIMLFLALFFRSENRGNVLPGLVIAAMGVTANSIFWFRYKRLSISERNAILEVQSKLYRAKTFVDLCVVIALTAVLFVPGSQLAYLLDLLGSIIVAVYLSYSGIRVMLPKQKADT